MYLVSLSIPTMAPHQLRIAALDGVAELGAAAADPGAATRLVARLGSDNPVGWLEALPIALFDRLCAAIFAHEFADEVECRSACTSCEEPFEFSFSLGHLIAAQDEAAGATGLVPDAQGYWQSEKGLELRAPTMGDLADLPDRKILVERLVRAGKAKIGTVEKMLEAAAPLLSLPIATACPHCSTDQAIRFDMAQFLVDSIAAERPFLIRETHLIASRYGWDHAVICNLPRRDRQAYAALIESERSASLKWRTG